MSSSKTTFRRFSLSFFLNRATLFAAALFLIALAPSSAMAQQPAGPSTGKESEAQDRFKRGIELYEEENFSAALLEFRRAYELVPAYQVLYNVARTCYQLRDYTCSLKTFERYLADGGSQIDPKRKDEVEKELVSIRRRVVTVTVTSTKGATITVDGVSVGEAPLPAPIQVNEGHRLIRATMAGREPSEKTIDVLGGDSTSVDLTLRESSAVTAPTTPAPEASSGTPWVLWGVTGALAVGTAITGGLALSASSKADDIRSNGGTLSEYDSTESRMRALSITTDILGLVTIGVGVTALVLTLTSGPSAKKESRLERLGVVRF